MKDYKISKSLKNYTESIEEYQYINKLANNKANTILEESKYNNFKKGSTPFLCIEFLEKLDNHFLFLVMLGEEYYCGSEIKLTKKILIENIFKY